MDSALLDRFQGCLLGLALGDALGAAHEGGFAERLLWSVIGATADGRMRWTDDTQMSVDIGESLLARGGLDADDLAQRFARSYRWTRGYGPGTARLLKRIARGAHWDQANRLDYPEGSLGNGAAMRAPVIGLYFSHRQDELADAARLSARVTHAHPQGMAGAVLVASVTAQALRGATPRAILQHAAAACGLEPFVAKLEVAGDWLAAGAPGPAEVRQVLGNGVAARESCVTAVYLGLRFMESPFARMHDFVRQCGGDVDSIGAMAGAIWGAANGAARLPALPLARLEQRERLAALATALHQSLG